MVSIFSWESYGLYEIDMMDLKPQLYIYKSFFFAPFQVLTCQVGGIDLRHFSVIFRKSFAISIFTFLKIMITIPTNGLVLIIMEKSSAHYTFFGYHTYTLQGIL